MIRLGTYNVSIYPNSGILWENDGTVEFHGHCSIGNNSSLSIGANGVVTFGDKFSASTTLRLVCYNRISFEERVLIGWECTFMDTDLHRMKKLDGGYTKGVGSILIGKGCWFANRCTVLKYTQTAEYNTFSTGSIVSKKFDIPYRNALKLKYPPYPWTEHFGGRRMITPPDYVEDRVTHLITFPEFDAWLSTVDYDLTVEVEFKCKGMCPRMDEILAKSPNVSKYIFFSGDWEVLEEMQEHYRKNGKPQGLRLGANIRFINEKTMDFVNKKAFEGTLLAHTDGQVPNFVVNVPEVNEFYLGELFYFFEFACGVSGYLLGVNPFNQPGVESYKKNMFALLGKPGYEAETEAIKARL